jgi:hypothetical protein
MAPSYYAVKKVAGLLMNGDQKGLEGNVIGINEAFECHNI